MYKFEDVFTFENLNISYNKCLKNVSWKKSVQSYKANNLLYTLKLYKDLNNEKYRSKGFKEFTIKERGKVRDIKSVEFRERIVQKTLCDFCLNEVIGKKLIYDNGASIKNKGFHFSINRLNTHLKRFYRGNKKEGYILLFDFKKYFENIDHNHLISIINNIKEIDEEIKKLSVYFIKQFGNKGLGLGSQISQIFSLFYANGLDHYIKHKLKIKYYGRYMDDGYIIHENKEYLKDCLMSIKNFCESFGIVLHSKKTQIISLKHKFSYLKVRWFVTDSGKILNLPSKKNTLRMKKKLKKFKVKLNGNKMFKEDIKRSFLSWRGNLKYFDSYFIKKRMDKYFNDLFKGELYV